jgi:hypothetical protein
MDEAGWGIQGLSRRVYRRREVDRDVLNVTVWTSGCARSLVESSIIPQGYTGLPGTANDGVYAVFAEV